MSAIRFVARGSCLIGLTVLLAGCIIAPRGGYHDGYSEGYYDRAHHRYYHDHEWHQCHDRDDRDDRYCR
jgi:hypothetical protein